MAETISNPYAKMYDPAFGTIIGRPMAFNPRADPNQRIYQETLLKNNTIVRITPGVYEYNKDTLEKAAAILKVHQEKESVIKNAGGSKVEQKLSDLNNATQSELVSKKIDMRYLTFKPAFKQFLSALQVLINRTSTSLFLRKMNSQTGSKSGFLTDITTALSVNENQKYRGFNLWVEKSTSISESVNNSFTSSVFEGLDSKVSRWSREVQAITGMNVASAAAKDSDVPVSVDGGLFGAEASLVGGIAQRARAALTGAKVIIPQIWDDSKFSRSYNISFRFTSPYGDDRSAYVNVILPFLFLLTCALPKQDGPSGQSVPFLLQMDCPGRFSTPMGVITDLSFIKGGSDMLFNASGLPMVIEGTFAVSDLYNSLSLPLENSQMLTNFGTAAFLNNLVGASLYQSEDPGMAEQLSNYVKGGLIAVTDPLNAASAQTLKILRWTGVLTETSVGGIGNAIANAVASPKSTLTNLFSGSAPRGDQ